MSIPLRVNNNLFKEAETEGLLMNRSAAKQVEFWAELGKRVAHSVTPADMLALMQGIAKVIIEIPDLKPIDPVQLFAKVDKANLTGKLGQHITQGAVYYEASQGQPGLLDQVTPDGNRQTGRYKNGKFLPE